MVWNPESTLVWNPESRRLESGIQRVEIQNPDAGIRTLEVGIQNPGPSWILLHGAKQCNGLTSAVLHFIDHYRIKVTFNAGCLKCFKNKKFILANTVQPATGSLLLPFIKAACLVSARKALTQRHIICGTSGVTQLSPIQVSMGDNTILLCNWCNTEMLHKMVHGVLAQLGEFPSFPLAHESKLLHMYIDSVHL